MTRRLLSKWSQGAQYWRLLQNYLDSGARVTANQCNRIQIQMAIIYYCFDGEEGKTDC